MPRASHSLPFRTPLHASRRLQPHVIVELVGPILSKVSEAEVNADALSRHFVVPLSRKTPWLQYPAGACFCDSPVDITKKQVSAERAPAHPSEQNFCKIQTVTEGGESTTSLDPTGTLALPSGAIGGPKTGQAGQVGGDTRVQCGKLGKWARPMTAATGDTLVQNLGSGHTGEGCRANGHAWVSDC